jgi:hypothetical protein
MLTLKRFVRLFRRKKIFRQRFARARRRFARSKPERLQRESALNRPASRVKRYTIQTHGRRRKDVRNNPCGELCKRASPAGIQKSASSQQEEPIHHINPA